jgi:hypothetical protein
MRAVLWLRPASAGGQRDGPRGAPALYPLSQHPQPFIECFPWAYARLVSLAERVGTAIGLDTAKLERVRFCNDIRHITYQAPADGCPWHRDDPASHFNTIVMLAQPGADFEGGNLLLHPGPCLDPSDAGVAVRRWSAGWGTRSSTRLAPLTDHMVETVTRGIRRICLTELQPQPQQNTGLNFCVLTTKLRGGRDSDLRAALNTWWLHAAGTVYSFTFVCIAACCPGGF